MTTFFLVKSTSFLLISFITFSHQKYVELPLETTITESELKPLHLNYKNIDWVPSLYNSILITPSSTNIQEFNPRFLKRINGLKNKYYDEYYDESMFDCDLYEIDDLNGTFGTYLGKCKYGVYESEFGGSFYGLAPSVPKKIRDFEKDEYNLEILTNYNNSDYQIFSFDKWKIEENVITSKFYLGDTHEHFHSKEYPAGKCEAIDKEYWACSFKEMTFKNVVIPLKNKNDELYTIYFTSEFNDIVFPSEFSQKFLNASNGTCTAKYYGIEKFLECEGFAQMENNHIPLKLTGDKMNMTVEIDYYHNYHIPKGKPTNQMRLKFRGDNYIVFPMIMFKKFHVEFNNVNKTISFYSTDPSILEVYKEPEPEPQPEPPDESDVEPPEEKKLNFGIEFFHIISAIVIIAFCVCGIYLICRCRKKCKAKADRESINFIGNENIIDDENAFLDASMN